MLWLDVLDYPAVNFYEACFAEDFEEQKQETKRQDGDSLAFYGSGVLPDGTAATTAARSSTTPMRARVRSSSACCSPATSTRATARGCAMPIPSPAVRCCRRWAPRSPCCRKGFTASPAARPMARSSSAPRRRLDASRRSGAAMGAERRLRGAALETLFAYGGEASGAVLDLRSAGAGSARHLARRHVGLAGDVRAPCAVSAPM